MTLLRLLSLLGLTRPAPVPRKRMWYDDMHEAEGGSLSEDRFLQLAQHDHWLVRRAVVRNTSASERVLCYIAEHDDHPINRRDAAAFLAGHRLTTLD